MIERRSLLFMRTLLLFEVCLGLALRHASQEVMHRFARGLIRSHRGVLGSRTLVLGLLP